MVSKKMLACLDEAFKFKVGDLVQHRGHDAADLKAVTIYERKHCVLTVLERIVQQCSGGVQLGYSVRPASSGTIWAPTKVMEIELTPYEPAKPEPLWRPKTKPGEDKPEDTQAGS